MKPNVGEAAPEFNTAVVGGEYPEGSTVSLSDLLPDLRGKRVVLVFYPRDNTPGCTTQACAIRDGWDDLKEKAHVFGVSADDEASHQKFINKQNLPYPLLSDTDHSVVEAYGVWVEKSMYGKKYMGIERSTFVIGEDGVIEAVFEKVKPAEHLDKLLAFLD